MTSAESEHHESELSAHETTGDFGENDEMELSVITASDTENLDSQVDDSTYMLTASFLNLKITTNCRKQLLMM